MEHDYCCSCASDLLPDTFDDGHCCADCQLCKHTVSSLPPRDFCAGVSAGVCDTVSLVRAVEHLIRHDTAAQPASPLGIDRRVYCACVPACVTFQCCLTRTARYVCAFQLTPPAGAGAGR